MRQDGRDHRRRRTAVEHSNGYGIGGSVWSHLADRIDAPQAPKDLVATDIVDRWRPGGGSGEALCIALCHGRQLRLSRVAAGKENRRARRDVLIGGDRAGSCRPATHPLGQAPPRRLPGRSLPGRGVFRSNKLKGPANSVLTPITFSRSCRAPEAIEASRSPERPTPATNPARCRTDRCCRVARENRCRSSRNP